MHLHPVHGHLNAQDRLNRGKKLGGFLGKATGVSSGDSGKSEAKLDFQLVPVDGTSPKLQSSASGRKRLPMPALMPRFRKKHAR